LANIVFILPHSNWDPEAEEKESEGIGELDDLFGDVSQSNENTDFTDDEWRLR